MQDIRRQIGLAKRLPGTRGVSHNKGAQTSVDSQGGLAQARSFRLAICVLNHFFDVADLLLLCVLSSFLVH